MSSKASPKVHVRPRLLQPHERRRLAGATLCEERTILRWERGEMVRPATKHTLDEAARKLGLPVPMKRKDQP